MMKSLIKCKYLAASFLGLMAFQALGDIPDQDFSPRSYGNHSAPLSSDFLVGAILDNQRAIASVDNKVDKLEARVDHGFKDIRSEMKAQGAELRSEMKAQGDDIRSEMREGFARIDGTLTVILDFMNRSQAHQERAEAFMADSTY